MNSTSMNEVLKLAFSKQQAGHLVEAEQLYRQIVAVYPNSGKPLEMLGLLLLENGDPRSAVPLLQRAVSVTPNSAVYQFNLGRALDACHRLPDALSAYREAIRIRPSLFEAHLNVGSISVRTGDFCSAESSLRTAIALNPEFAMSHYNLGVALTALGRHEEAIASYARTIALKVDYADAYNNIGATFHRMGRFEKAVEILREGIKANPASYHIWNNLSSALYDLDKLDEAVFAANKAREFNSNSAEAYRNLANAYKDQGQLDEALDAYDRAIALSPSDPSLLSARLFFLEYHPSFRQTDILRAATRWDQLHGQPLRKYIKPHANSRDPNRKLRIGYVSPDFTRHCASLFISPLLSSHDHERFDIYCYSSVTRPDEITSRLRPLATVWRDVQHQSDESLADIIRNDQIDILVDLTMHMAHGRLQLFARKPAPIQVAWLAYPGTTGLSTMDYRLTDPYLDPPGQHDADYCETSIRLADSFWCYDPLTSGPEVNDLPAQRNGYITFGCLNNFCKINDDVLALWARILKEVNNSRLLLLAPEGSSRQRTIKKLSDLTVERNRVQFVHFLPRSLYLQNYHQIDIGLDTIHCSGHTTSLDSFWMGVPVVSLSGETVAGRAGLSLLANLGLTELAAETVNQCVNIAANLARDIPRLSSLRQTLRSRMEASPLMDARRFAANVEAAYSEMWRNWCKRGS